jgi:hypothetical protein
MFKVDWFVAIYNVRVEEPFLEKDGEVLDATKQDNGKWHCNGPRRVCLLSSSIWLSWWICTRTISRMDV